MLYAHVFRTKDVVPDYEPDQNYLYPYWAGVTFGPIVYILAIVHALLWGFPSSIVGSIVSFCTTNSKNSMGMVLL